MTTVQEMKVLALRQALAAESDNGNPDGRGHSQVTSITGEFQLECAVYKLTKFMFVINQRRDGASYSPGWSVDELAADAFLKALS